MNEIDNELQFVQAFEVRELGWITCGHECIKTSANQRACAAAQHCLLTKKIGLRLLPKGRLHHAGARASDCFCPRQRRLFRVPAGILLNGYQAWHAATSHKLAAHHWPQALWRNQHNIDVLARQNCAVMNGKAMREK